MASAKARKIQELREARGLSTDEVAHHMGVDAATVQQWEAGDLEPDEETLARLTRALGASQDELRHEGDARHHPER
ncbi:MAG: helix-turn-helix transcriptional regulator [Thermomicrobiales bacterium]